MPAKKKTAPVRRPRKAAKGKFDLRCKDCGFMAAHPMGLGRHRSTRHGAISKRAARGVAANKGGSGGVWITRQQAAERAGVHYNTIRQWERAGALRKGSNPGARETLVSAADVVRLAATRTGHGGGDAGLTAVDATRLSALERAQRELADGLEQLAAALRASVVPSPATPGRKRGRPLGSENAPKVTPPTPKKAAKRAPTKAAKRKTAKRAANGRRKR